MENKLSTLSPDIRLIVECCKKEQDKIEIKNCISKINDWKIFINLSFAHGVFPLVYHTLKQYQELIPSDIIESMKSNNMDIVKQNMLMTSELLKVMKLLEENGIEAISFKGPVLSQMAYGDIVSRQYVDLDILVDKKDLEKASKILLENKYNSTDSVELLKNKDYLKKDNDFSFFSTNSIHIEIHWKLFREKIGNNIDIKDYKNNIFINNNKIMTLSFEVLFVYLCLHGSKHVWERLEWILDIDRLIRFNNNTNWNKIIKLAKEMNCEISLHLGLNLSREVFKTKYPSQIELLIDTPQIKKLSQKTIYFIQNNFVLEENYKKYQEVNLFQLGLINSKRDKLRHIIFTYFSITKNDYLSFPLHSYLHFLHYFIKPFRVLIKVLVRGK